MNKEYDYNKEYKKVLAEFLAHKISKEKAIHLCGEIEDKAYEVYPNAEPDGDITYGCALTVEEIIKNDK